MPARAPTERETWKDWIGPDAPEPDDLYTRAEIVERANGLIRDHHKPVKAGDLQLWEKLDILPRGIRRRHGGAQYSLYPAWHAYLARQVRQLQREGYSLDEIKPRVRAYARMTLEYGRTSIDEEIGRNVQSPEEIMLWPVLVEELERLGRWWAHLQGVEAERVEVHVVGTNGRATKYPLPLKAYPEQKEN